MLYQYKNFRTKDMNRKRIIVESKKLFKLVILMIIVNLILLSFYNSEKNKYEDNKKKDYNFSTKLNSTDEQLMNAENIKKKKIIKLINDNEFSSLCRKITYNNDSLEVESAPKDIDKLYEKVQKYHYLNQCVIEGNSTKFTLKLVLK